MTSFNYRSAKKLIYLPYVSNRYIAMNKEFRKHIVSAFGSCGITAVNIGKSTATGSLDRVTIDILEKPCSYSSTLSSI